MTAVESASAAAIRASVVRGERTAADVALAAIERARATGALGGELNLLLAADADYARAQADALGGASRDRPLFGVPVVVKDNIATERMPTSCGSRMLEGYVSPYEATAVARLRRAGAVIVAKSNMDEFGMGSSTEHSAYGVARNPLAPERVPGGSSGGSAGAVAAGITPIALGSETGGSVRQPAAFCGVVGVKPTYGRVSRHGLVAFASSLDQIGVFGATVDDAARALGAIAGPDPLDSTSAALPVPDYTAAASAALTGVVIGRPAEYFPESLDSRIRARCDAALAHLRALGAEVREVSLSRTNIAIQIYYIIAPAEASSNLARFDGVRYGRRVSGDGVHGMYEATRSRGFGPEVTRRILLGTFALSAGYAERYYHKAQEARGLLARDFHDVFRSGVHALFTPTTPTPAFLLGAKADPYEMYLSDVFTCPANLAGLPALSLPIGRVDGLPIGGQLIASHFDERQLFAVAYALERALGDEARR